MVVLFSVGGLKVKKGGSDGRDGKADNKGDRKMG